MADEIKTPMVFEKDGQVKTNSLIVAEQFGKDHKHVLRDIKTLDCSDKFNRSNFGPVDYIDSKGEERPMVDMTRDGFMFLVMGYRGKKAAQIKEAFIAVFNMYEQIAMGKSLPTVASADMMVQQAFENLCDRLPAIIDERVKKAIGEQTKELNPDYMRRSGNGVFLPTYVWREVWIGKRTEFINYLEQNDWVFRRKPNSKLEPVAGKIRSGYLCQINGQVYFTKLGISAVRAEVDKRVIAPAIAMQNLQRQLFDQ